jgi:hypothetical protein
VVFHALSRAEGPAWQRRKPKAVNRIPRSEQP